MKKTPSPVYFTDMHATDSNNLPTKLQKLLTAAGFDKLPFKGKFVAVKLHFGEPGNLAFLRPNYAAVICARIREFGGIPFVTDCNTLYVGGRKNALDHLDSAYRNGYNPLTLNGVHTIIADGLRGLDERLVPVKNGEYVKQAKIGSAIMDADIVISLSHFKCHELTGIGGAIKNLGMGSGSRAGKMEMHSSGKPHVNTEQCIGCGRCAKNCAHGAPIVKNKKAVIDHEKCVGCGRCIGTCPVDAVQTDFNEANEILNYKMAEYALAVVQDRPHFHISLAVDISPFCDCHGHNDIGIVPDIGMFASADPVAIDKACADAVNRALPRPGSLLAEKLARKEKNKSAAADHFAHVSPGTDWLPCLRHSEKIGLGTMEYELTAVE